MPFKCVYNFVSELCNGQKGEAPLAILFPLGILAIGFIVLYAVFGSTLYSANQDSATAGNNPAIYQAGPGAFSPVTNLEKFTEQNHERAYSTLKGAIADLNSTNTDNMSLNEQYKRK